MSIKSTILFPILSIVTLFAAGGIAGALALVVAFVAATLFLVHLTATTMARLCRPLAPAYYRHRPRGSRRSPW